MGERIERKLRKITCRKVVKINFVYLIKS